MMALFFHEQIGFSNIFFFFKDRCEVIYFGTTFLNEGSKPKVLARISQSIAAMHIARQKHLVDIEYAYILSQSF